MNSKLKNDSTDYLFKAILSLENEEDCYRFFEDLCTSAELKACLLYTSDAADEL